ncbi:hypothetical protein CY34DRAFT_804931 [Suillus luteus UH-Slu-Lm8-n1]|uniref:Uncharacterized protein n=1 Tax=Suillus luteus UH-Slu-Lm8-n1 TaxID=930992 RepID=A0A0D0AX90_9AGAM|nr:hypothetical protein CY34DRAFT_804931 [Suillus luteus UH-Slu-Lm8-n1]
MNGADNHSSTSRRVRSSEPLQPDRPSRHQGVLSWPVSTLHCKWNAPQNLYLTHP